MKSFFKSWKTTLAGLTNFGCVVAPFIWPGSEILCCKIAACATTLGFCAAKDHTETPITPNGMAKASNLFLFAGFLAFIITVCCAFKPTTVRTQPQTFIGSGLPITNALASNAFTGSFYFQTDDTNDPLWARTGTNSWKHIVAGNTGTATNISPSLNLTNMTLYNSVIKGSVFFPDAPTLSHLAVDGDGNLEYINSPGQIGFVGWDGDGFPAEVLVQAQTPISIDEGGSNILFGADFNTNGLPTNAVTPIRYLNLKSSQGTNYLVPAYR